jgi:hypothetical protein
MTTSIIDSTTYLLGISLKEYTMMRGQTEGLHYEKKNINATRHCGSNNNNK